MAGLGHWTVDSCCSIDPLFFNFPPVYDYQKFVWKYPVITSCWWCDLCILFVIYPDRSFDYYVWNKLLSSSKLDGSLLLEIQDQLSGISLSCHMFPLTITNLDLEIFHQSHLSFALCGSKLLTVRFELDIRALNLFLNLNWN